MFILLSAPYLFLADTLVLRLLEGIDYYSFEIIQSVPKYNKWIYGACYSQFIEYCDWFNILYYEMEYDIFSMLYRKTMVLTFFESIHALHNVDVSDTFRSIMKRGTTIPVKELFPRKPAGHFLTDWTKWFHLDWYLDQFYFEDYFFHRSEGIRAYYHCRGEVTGTFYYGNKHHTGFVNSVIEKGYMYATGTRNYPYPSTLRQYVPSDTLDWEAEVIKEEGKPPYLANFTQETPSSLPSDHPDRPANLIHFPGPVEGHTDLVPEGAMWIPNVVTHIKYLFAISAFVICLENFCFRQTKFLPEKEYLEFDYLTFSLPKSIDGKIMHTLNVLKARTDPHIMKLIEYNKDNPILAPLYRHLTETNCDVPEAWQLGFQDPATPIMEGLIDLHHTINFFLAVILVFVTWLIMKSVVIYKDRGHKSEWTFFHGQTIEIVWTTIPALILIVIAVPSFALLYSMDEVIDPAMTIKVIGHQWYWSYEMSDNLGESINYDSYMVKTPDLEPGEFRLLEVDNSVIVPTHTHVRVIVTSSDVIHSWAIPSLGIKIDACPGRLNQTTFFIKRAGYYYGQCSEICGVNHAYMPICIEAKDIADYIQS